MHWRNITEISYVLNLFQNVIISSFATAQCDWPWEICVWEWCIVKGFESDGSTGWQIWKGYLFVLCFSSCCQFSRDWEEQVGVSVNPPDIHSSFYLEQPATCLTQILPHVTIPVHGCICENIYHHLSTTDLLGFILSEIGALDGQSNISFKPWEIVETC